jgi:hypothetical protein
VGVSFTWCSGWETSQLHAFNCSAKTTNTLRQWLPTTAVSSSLITGGGEGIAPISSTQVQDSSLIDSGQRLRMLTSHLLASS